MSEGRTREAVLWIACTLLLLALVYVVTLDLWGLRLWGTEVDYARFGNWSEALGGIGTTTAVVVALATLYWQHLQHRTAEADRRRERETSVFHWLETKEVKESSGGSVGWMWDLRVTNSTAGPIYKWTVLFGEGRDHLCSYIKRPLIPGENVFNLPFLDNIDPSHAPLPTLTFSGSSGRVWRRSAQGAISEVQLSAPSCSHDAGRSGGGS